MYNPNRTPKSYFKLSREHAVVAGLSPAAMPGRCDRSKCRDVSHDCNANAAAGEPAACAEGYQPTLQPTVWGANNFDCCTVAPARNDAKAFAGALETCIRDVAATVASTVPAWADHCESVTDKVVFQRRQLGRALDPVFAAHGYTGALWCAFYASAWPMGWTDGNWYDWYLCPAARVCSGREALGDVDEAVGGPGAVNEGETAPIVTMSCALCQVSSYRLGGCMAV